MSEPEPPVALAVMRRLQARIEALAHDNAHLEERVTALRHLVGEAFEEGFRARRPDEDEPWLIDWLQSKSKARLRALLAGGETGQDGGGDT